MNHTPYTMHFALPLYCIPCTIHHILCVRYFLLVDYYGVLLFHLSEVLFHFKLAFWGAQARARARGRPGPEPGLGPGPGAVPRARPWAAAPSPIHHGGHGPKPVPPAVLLDVS